jgi:hypothetical protein
MEERAEKMQSLPPHPMHKKAFAAMSVISYKGTDKKTVKL